MKERSSWLTRYRRLTIDYEVLPTTSEVFIYAAMVRLMIRRKSVAVYTFHTSSKTEEEPGAVGENLAASPLESSNTLVSTEVTTETASAEPKQVNRTAPSSTSRNKTTKVKPATKTAKKSARWQDYGYFIHGYNAELART